jgi:hypothetical protein
MAVTSLLGTLAAAASSSALASSVMGYRDDLLAAGAPRALLSLLREWALDGDVVRGALRALVCLAEGAAGPGAAEAGAGAGAASSSTATTTTALLGRILLPPPPPSSSSSPNDTHDEGRGLPRRACRALLRFTPTDPRIRRDGCAALGLLLHYPFPPTSPSSSATGGGSGGGGGCGAIVRSPALAAAAAGRRRAALLDRLVKEGAVRRLVEALLHCCLEAEADAAAEGEQDEEKEEKEIASLRRETVGLAVRALRAVAVPPLSVVAAEDVDSGARRRRSLVLAGALPALMAVLEGRAWGVEVGLAALGAMRAVVAAEREEDAAATANVAVAGAGAGPEQKQQQHHWRLVEVLGRVARYAVARVLSPPPPLPHPATAPAAAAAPPPPAGAVVGMDEAKPYSNSHHPCALPPDHPLAVEALQLLVTLSQAAAAAASHVLQDTGVYRAWLASVETRLQQQHQQQQRRSESLHEAALLGDFMAALVIAAPTPHAAHLHARALVRCGSARSCGGRPALVVAAELMRRVEEEGEGEEGLVVLEGLRRLHTALALAEQEGDEEEEEEAAATCKPAGLPAAFSSSSSSFPSLAALAQGLLLDAADPPPPQEQEQEQGRQPPQPKQGGLGRVPSSVLGAAAGLLMPQGPLPGPAGAVGSALGSVPALAWATVRRVATGEGGGGQVEG